MNSDFNELTKKAAEIISEADALIITAGAGMGVDSGLPDFRGNEGFWNAYPPYRALGKSFVEMANPAAFTTDPEFAWGFYGHRLQLYRETPPHQGFSILKKWAEQKQDKAFVMTSNVDGHFQRSGFPDDSIYEVHGSLQFLQCTSPCPGSEILSAEDLDITIDKSTMRAVSPLPTCRECGRIARPNVLMFGDWSYLGDRNEEQERRLQSWLVSMEEQSVAIIEFGAGSAVPTVRLFSEDCSRKLANATLIRVNPRESEIPGSRGISIPSGALAAIEGIDKRIT